MMKNKSLNISIATLAIAFFIMIIVPTNVSAQNCGCAEGVCCSQYGYCGNTDTYCGTGCQEGPCKGGNIPPSTPSPSNDVNVADIVTPEFFNGIIDQADSSCAGKSFYSRAAFLDALDSYNQFGRAGSSDDSKREVAALIKFHLNRSISIGFQCLCQKCFFYQEESVVSAQSKQLNNECLA